MLNIERIDTSDKRQVRRFVQLPYRLYANSRQWVPPLLTDVETQLNRNKHPFFEHSDADFFIAVRDGRVVGRIAALENRRFNNYHGARQAQFYLFDCENDPEAAGALFQRVLEWAHARGLEQLAGPKGMSAFDGYGLLVEGFEHRQMMTMMSYNYDYYPSLVEAAGLRKVVDFVSCHIRRETFVMPERVHRIAERAAARSKLQVQQFTGKRELVKWVPRIVRAYDKAFTGNWEYYPLTEREIQFIVDNLMPIADPKLIKIITHGEEVVGFLLAFADVSAALQRARGYLLPFGLPDLLIEMRRTKWVAINGLGILSEFQGHGGNALLYSEMEKTIRHSAFVDAELVQVAETAVQMRRDLAALGAPAHKNHRVYARAV